MITGRAWHECWEMARPFVISRGSAEVSDVIVVELSDGVHRGRGEAMPISRYGQSISSALAACGSIIDDLATQDWDTLHDRLPADAARNAVDCAVWDLRAKRAGRRVWDIAGLPSPQPLATAMTIGIDSPAAMADRAADSGHDLIKLKLGGPEDLDRVAAVRDRLPAARIIVDANEAWTADTLAGLFPELRRLNVAMIEQPLPEDDDEPLAGMARPVPVCADESCHTSADLDRLAGRYDVLNIKLDKTGGLTEALRLANAARAAGFAIMIGCMEGTSLAMAPGVLVGQGAAFVDLDGPLLIGRDRDFGLRYRDGTVGPPDARLWG